MSEFTENTFTAYLGPEFQQRLMWQVLVEPEFAEKTIPNLSVEYFDDPNLKRLFLIILEFINLYEKVPNLQNQSIYQAINLFKTPNNVIEEESLSGVLERIKLWNERVLNKQLLHDGDVIQKATNTFIRQQEYRKLGEFILDKTKTGDIKHKYVLELIEEKIQKISHIGDEEDDGIDVTENIEKALRKEFRQTIPTGIEVLDTVTGGGLGKGEIGLILTPSGVGKAQPLSSKLLTPNGWIRMGDVKIGDFVIGSDGKSQKVLGVYPQGTRPIYKIEFNDGTSTFCDEEHIWAVNSRNNRTANTTIKIDGKNKHIKTSNLEYTPKITKDLITSIRLKNGGLNYRIPIVKAIEFNENELLINPYLLGALIGDGGLTEGIRFTNIDKEIIDKIIGIVNDDFNELSVKQVSNTITYSISGKRNVKNRLYSLIKFLRLNVKSYEKFIPDTYKYTSIKNRIALLQGLLDTDGYASKSGRIQYSTSSEKLANDIKELVLSLGGFCTKREKLPKYKYNDEIRFGKKSYILTISFSDENVRPFTLDRKQNRVKYRKFYDKNKYITSILYSHEEEAQCIYVENRDHLYVTDDYILTHNTTILTKIANTARELDYNVLQIIFEDTVEQIQRKHATIWTGVGLSSIDDNNEFAIQKANEKIKKLGNNGRLIIKKFSQEDTTMKDIRSWILRYQKKWGFKFDIVILDYLDCLDSHKKTNDRNEAELVIVKSFEAMAGDFNIPCWSAIQSNRSGFDAELVEAHQSGGNIKRVQKAHFFMSIAKTPDQKEAHLANIRIIKARFAQDGQTFKDCIFNNDTMQIIIRDDRYASDKYKNMKKYGDKELEKLENKASSIELHSKISDVAPIYQPSDDAILNDMKEAYLIQEANKNNKKGETLIDEKSDDVFELDTNIGITAINPEELALTEADNTVTNNDNEIFTWTGETITVKEEIVEVSSEIIRQNEISGKDVVEVYPENFDISELEILLKNSDEVNDQQKQVFNYLDEISKKQKIIKDD